MTDWKRFWPRLSRRHLLMLSAGAGLTPALARAQAQPKLSQKDALYQEEPKDMQNCAMCTLFQPPSACKVVEGSISANGWCRLFDMSD